jgi:hypothetical protein
LCTCRGRGVFTAALLQEMRDAKAATCSSLQNLQAVGIE